MTPVSCLRNFPSLCHVTASARSASGQFLKELRKFLLPLSLVIYDETEKELQMAYSTKVSLMLSIVRSVRSTLIRTNYIITLFTFRFSYIERSYREEFLSLSLSSYVHRIERLIIQAWHRPSKLGLLYFPKLSVWKRQQPRTRLNSVLPQLNRGSNVATLHSNHPGVIRFVLSARLWHGRGNIVDSFAYCFRFDAHEL